MQPVIWRPFCEAIQETPQWEHTHRQWSLGFRINRIDNSSIRYDGARNVDPGLAGDTSKGAKNRKTWLGHSGSEGTAPLEFRPNTPLLGGSGDRAPPRSELLRNDHRNSRTRSRSTSGIRHKNRAASNSGGASTGRGRNIFLCLTTSCARASLLQLAIVERYIVYI